MNRKLIIALLLLVATFVLAACGSPAGAKVGATRPTTEEVVSASFNAEKPTIIVETFNGNVEVTVSSGTAVKVDVTKRGSGETAEEAKSDLKNIQVNMNQEGSTVRVTAQRSDQRKDVDNSGASAKVVVPPGSILQIRTSNGKVTAAGEADAVTIQSSNGAIEVRGATGLLDLKTSNGNITVNGGSEKIALETSNGAVEVTTTKEVQITATSSNGALRFSGPLADQSKNVLRTDNALIVVTLPEEASFALDAGTSNGKIISDLTVKGDNPRETELKGTVGANSQTTLNLQTSNANIELHKGK
ncbi:hypothetical protein TFLX_05018 [Thermoflexales bacterium]|nr:hypothetical protein TFLX_05018 [Thermoflexales bacterium]